MHADPSGSSPAGAPAVRRLPTVTAAQLQGLAGLLIDCVEGGASVSFLHPLSHAKALAFKMLVHRRARRCGLGPLSAALPCGARSENR
jgi:hypothetical protein